MKISACVISRDAPYLEAAIRSIEPHVDEVVVVNTDVWTEANDAEGRICDFAKARQHSFNIAQNDCCLWLDSDDLVEGGENLKKYLDGYAARSHPSLTYFPYEYSYDSAGRCNCRHYRERICSDRTKFHWAGCVHEVLVPNEGVVPYIEFAEDVVWKHRRQYLGIKSDPGRNLRIFEQHIAKNGLDDPRTVFYYANELMNNGRLEEAAKHYEKYIDTSEWDDERAMACLAMVKLHLLTSNYQQALRWAMKTIETKEVWGEGYLAAAKCSYFLAQQDPKQPSKYWSKCVNFASLGLGMPPTKSALFLDPNEKMQIHEFLNVALSKMGDINGALASVQAAEAAEFSSPNQQHNKRIYQEYLLKELESRPLDIVVWTGPAVEPWNPESINGKGIGGSETACVHMCKELAKLGHKVRVFGDCAEKEGVFEGVEYAHYQRISGVKSCDVLISSRQPQIVDAPFKTKLRLLWIHDIHAGAPSADMHRWLLKFDRLLCLSQWHKEFVLKTYPFLHESKVIVTRNGIDLSRFGTPSLEKRPNRLIYSSSADRGLEPMLDMLPAIRARVPDAELHIYYGFDWWIKFSKDAGDEAALSRIDALQKRIAATPGVVFHGRVNQKELANAFLSSKVWSYPTWFTETSCISAMEAQAAGCVPVTTKLAALAETVKSGFLLDPPNSEPHYRVQFVDRVCDLLRDELTYESHAKKGMEAAKSFSWEALAREWVSMIVKSAREVTENPVPRFGGEYL